MGLHSSVEIIAADGETLAVVPQGGRIVARALHAAAERGVPWRPLATSIQAGGLRADQAKLVAGWLPSEADVAIEQLRTTFAGDGWKFAAGEVAHHDVQTDWPRRLPPGRSRRPPRAARR